MSRKNEDFDEFCDPLNPKILKYDDIVEASERVRPHIINTPVMVANTQKDFGIGIHYKLEFMQKSGSFKERGCLNALQLLPLDKKKLGIVIASSGNEALSMCYHAAKMNIPVIVVMPISLAIDKMQKCHGYGAKVVVQGANLVEAQKHARALARDKGLTYINGRDHPHILAGYGSLAIEILESTPFLDALIVPVGTGGLAAAMAVVIKQKKPSVLVYGVQPEVTPTFFKSLEAEEPAPQSIQNNVADAVTVSNVGCNAFATAKSCLDKMVGIRNDAASKSKLITLLAAGGFNIYRHFQDNSWTDGSDYFVEMKVCCETKDLAHALELKRAIERAYPCTSTFENEPFNDKRTCPCYIKKVANLPKII